ncbi:unnamed protein product, partial [Brassica oleracea]
EWDAEKIRVICLWAEKQIMSIRPSRRGAPDKFGMIDFREVWNNMKQRACLPPAGITAGHLAPSIMWEIWTARNKLVFSNQRLEAEDSLSRAISMAREWQEGEAPKENRRKTTIPHQVIAVGTTLKTDAAWSRSYSRAGLGWVVQQLGSTSTFTVVEENVSSPLLAEGLALREGLQ